MTRKRLYKIYDKLYQFYGPQYWWPAETPFEVAVGAILTQNTSWVNVERAIENLKSRDCLSFEKLLKMNIKTLSSLIRPAGYYNIKARRLKNFLKYLGCSYQGCFDKMRLKASDVLRQELLAVNGIGKETADSILLYALHKPVFVIDAYTKRVFSRHGFFKESTDYDEAQHFFLTHLELDAKIFNEFHALIVRLAKEFCRKNKKSCHACPLYGKDAHAKKSL